MYLTGFCVIKSIETNKAQKIQTKLIESSEQRIFNSDVRMKASLINNVDEP